MKEKKESQKPQKPQKPLGARKLIWCIARTKVGHQGAGILTTFSMIRLQKHPLPGV